MEEIVSLKNYDYKETKNAVNLLCSKYGFLHCGILGRSCLGRDIPYLKLGRQNEYVLFAASFHGSEHITTYILLRFLEELCVALKNDGYIAGLNAKKAFNGRALIVVPMVNPDGVEISIHGKKACGIMAEKIEKLCKSDYTHWNANARGVDINHNFPAGWHKLNELEKRAGIYGPAPTRFGGFSPLSEPESLSIAELCRVQKIRHAVAFHSQGEVIYWNYENYNPPRAQKMAEIMATSSGYALDIPLGLASGGGFKDWFISEFNRPAFTVEVGLGKNPLPLSQADNIYSNLKEMLMLSAIM